MTPSDPQYKICEKIARDILKFVLESKERTRHDDRLEFIIGAISEGLYNAYDKGLSDRRYLPSHEKKSG